MGILFDKLLSLFTTSEEPAIKEVESETESETESKSWYEQEQEERADLEERAKHALKMQGHTRPEIVKTMCNRELIRIIWDYEKTIKKNEKE